MPRRSTNLSLSELAAQVERLTAQLAKVTSRPAFPAAAATQLTIRQTAHAFVLGEALRLSGSSFVKALADTAANAQVVGLVGAVLGPDAFVLVLPGSLLTGLAGLTAGSRYYLSATTAGAATVTPPTIAAALYDALSATSATLCAGAGGGGGVPAATTDGLVLATAPTTFTPAWTDTLDLGQVDTSGSSLRLTGPDGADMIVLETNSTNKRAVFDYRHSIVLKNSSGQDVVTLVGGSRVIARALAIRTVNICVSGADMQMDILGSVPY